MKKLAFMIAALVGVTAFAQETKINNEQTETVITREYVTDSKGTDVNTKTEKVTQSQDIALTNVKNVTSVDTNFNYTMTPMEFDSETTYFNDGTAYRFNAEQDKYKLMSLSEDNDMTTIATLRPTSQKGYYILTESGTSKFGYFNSDGHFVVESYDPDDDAISVTVYSIRVTPETKVMKKKM
jgi:hypothetical protein